MQCRNVLTRIDARRTGELETHEEQLVKKHLDRCISCRDSVADVEDFAAAVKTLVVRPPRSCLVRLNQELADKFDVFPAAGEQVWVAFSDRGIRMIDIRATTEEQFERKYQKKFGRGLRRAALPARYRKQVIAGLEGKGVAEPEVDLSGLSDFERAVLRTIVRIPRGEVRPYRWVARQVRRPAAARAIGNIMAGNPVPFLLPCHRVVPSGGGVGKYGFGSAMKQTLLTREGVTLENLRKPYASRAPRRKSA